MNNLQLYNRVFIESFQVISDQLENLTYRSIPAWDSVGHMAMIAALEETFSIMFDPNDILDFTSYETGKQILTKYNILF
ncbi:MAG: acyl carrier protein [Bacteroidales bacterium]|nr:acyl carrier protein [Bacteroidales bacterium]